MSFTRTRLPGFWTFNSAVAPAEFEHIDDYAYAIDGQNGGTYAPTGLLTFGGLGVTITSPFNASDAKVISVDTSLTIELGANLLLFGNQIVNSGAIVGFTSGSFLTVSSGGTFTMNAGSTASIAATTTLSGTTTISGALTITKGVVVTQSTANTPAITCTGNGSGSGATCTGGATGPGITAVSGTAQTNTTPTCAAQFAGYIQLTGTDPNQGVDPGANNALHAIAIPKAWGNVVLSGGSPYTPVGSYNVDTVEDTATPGEYKVTFKRAMANAFYAPIVIVRTVGFAAAVVGISAGHFTFRVFATDTLALTTDLTAIFHVFGAQ